jgi:hypothetical protein
MTTLIQACGASLAVRAALGPAAIVTLGSVTTGRPWILPTIYWLATSSNTPAALKWPLLTGRNGGQPVVSNSAKASPPSGVHDYYLRGRNRVV